LTPPDPHRPGSTGPEAWPSGLPELRCGHSLAVTGRGCTRRLWITDPGRRARLVEGAIARTEHEPRVVALEATGSPVLDLGVNGVLAERWIGQVERAARASTADLPRLVRARSPIVSLTIMIGLTFAIIYVMVVKPTLF